jgi:hypothetical protein
MSLSPVKEGKSGIINIRVILVALFVLLQLYLIFINRHFMLEIDASPNTNPTPPIFGERVVGQTFVAERNRLSRIDVFLGSFNRENDHDVMFELGILNEKAVVRKVFNASQVKGRLYHTITFAPQKKSKGKIYSFSFSSSESTQGNSICAWRNTGDIYPEGAYFLNDQSPGGDLVFRSYSSQPVFAAFKKMTRQYSGIWGNPVVLIAAVIIFLAVQVMVLIKLLDMALKPIEQKTLKKPRWP